MGEIDEQLITAAKSDNEKFFRDAIRTKPTEYFCNTGMDGKNFLHIAMASTASTTGLIQRALCQLPGDTVRSLMCQQDIESLNNPLHYFAKYGSDVMVIHYIQIRFRDINDDIQKPWLASNNFGQTPLHVALLEKKLGQTPVHNALLDDDDNIPQKKKDDDHNNYQKLALSILGLDMELLCDIKDNEGNSPLFLAMERGFNTFALKILNSSCGFSCGGRDNCTSFHVAKYCSADVLELMLRKLPDHVEYCNNGNQNSMLHEMGKLGKVEHLKVLAMVNDALLNRLSSSRNNDGNTPMHLAIEFGHEQFALELVKRSRTENNSPWWLKNKLSITPFDMALSKHHERFLLHCIVKDRSGLYETDNNQKSRVFTAVEEGLDEVVQLICRIIGEGNGLQTIPIQNNQDGQTVLHIMSKCKEEETGRMLVQTFPNLINLADHNEKTPIDMASNKGNTWVIKLLLSTDQNCLIKSPKAWVEACQNGHLDALKALISHWEYFNELCAEQKDSPLHHIRLNTVEDYKELLRTPLLWEMKNSIDRDGKTPLHIALEREDIIFAEILLSSGVQTNIAATQLLADLCCKRYEWHVMRQRIEL